MFFSVNNLIFHWLHQFIITSFHLSSFISEIESDHKDTSHVYMFHILKKLDIYIINYLRFSAFISESSHYTSALEMSGRDGLGRKYYNINVAVSFLFSLGLDIKPADSN